MSSPSRQVFGPYKHSPGSVILVILFVVLFISGMSSLLLFKCYMRRRQRQRQTDTSIRPPSDSFSAKHRTGLDPSTLAAFPTLVYGNVKHLRRENLDLECAICLSEFVDESVLRLMTICYHVFHQECIDIWLEDHTSCPVCRANLDLPPEKVRERFPEVLVPGDVSVDTQEESAAAVMSEDAVRVEIGDDDVKEKVKMWSGEQPVTMADHRDEERYPRWHSTGHSFVVGQNRIGRECRFTLRLPEKMEDTSHGGGNVDSGGSGDCRTEQSVRRSLLGSAGDSK